jgi:hypothetical protein
MEKELALKKERDLQNEKDASATQAVASFGAKFKKPKRRI